MTRSSVCRWLELTGVVLLGIGVLLVAARHHLESSYTSGITFAVGAAEGLILLAQCFFMSVGGLLFLVRPLLRLRGWNGSIVFFALGVCVLFVVYSSFEGSRLLWSNPGFVLAVYATGYSSIFVGFVSLAAQWLVRRSERGRTS